ncbi:MAG: hypothetical protein GC138_03460 [Gammaproteobacteria bacterium]|nr:hypothetical protein [Gammaproteobacteria bacterium]
MPPPKPEHTAEALVAAARALALRLGTRRLAVGRFCAETGINPARVYARFDDWPALCASAGLEPGGERSPPIPADRMLADLHRAILAAGELPTQKKLVRAVPWSNATLVRRFGSWSGTLSALTQWIAVHDPAFPYRAALEARQRSQARRKAWRGPAAISRAAEPPWPALGRRACGEPLGFRAMLHAPVNEMGVVLVFGMVAHELGYAVDAVGAAFPDCHAKRRIHIGARESDLRWEAVRIEFEFRSRTFAHHGHDPEDCEVLVCWEHDWPDCPLEVLELKSAVAALALRDAGRGHGGDGRGLVAPRVGARVGVDVGGRGAAEEEARRVGGTGTGEVGGKGRPPKTGRAPPPSSRVIPAKAGISLRQAP